MAITGAHALLYSSEPEALRATLRDVFGWKHVDAGDGWLKFALPPAELGVHPAEGPTHESGVRHQLTLMCDDIEATVRELRADTTYLPYAKVIVIGPRNPGSSWNPGVAVTVTPEEYELEVRSWLEKAGPELQEFEVTHRETVQGASGEYNIDAVARFRALKGAKFVVLVECKRYTRPVERKHLITLLGKVRDVGAHKGMLFATCGFQSGAVRYAKQNGIAAITFTDGRFIYEALSQQPPPVEYRPPGLPRFVGLFLEPGQYGPSSSSILPDHLDPLSEWLGKAIEGA